MTLAETFDGVRVRAPGKINLFLEVGALQPDGYHELATAFQAVSLYEDLVATPSDDFTIEVSGTVDVSGVPTDDRNLALRAARLLAAETGHPGGVHLDVRKEVPVAGGMGGGSADAAAALVACDALWGTGLSSRQLHALGARLGADVPFALQGGTAVGSGRGDRLSPALARGRFEWVIVPNPDGLSTPEVYAELDRQRAGGGAVIPAPAEVPVVDPDVLHALVAGDARRLAGALANDLQAPALRMRRDLAEVLDLGEREGALAGIVSGSGPTLAFLAESAEDARGLQQMFARRGHEALHVSAPAHGARVV
ncbi:4-(cytidine 5'-diphospho)-2-C-methyl-D-erythritol kinase [Microbacterium excoecariae]|uniref:4-(cytidine 5'-diphospho)-2-C-methyl-D-erythritol kinase n=1 Tax=Microbacterium excoecariae TaxID=2715210 RepID=UPI001408D7E0|nr:4-(cytidine 5'-diphospho)-2-C-methyl-D-erythritol kinase [Microbacterium excoecariae]NHI17374.1 4-(cytidine 5'-diphospho)-2-C-methyl-D-erythritol kinase [Microbacterium excoecariae]